MRASWPSTTKVKRLAASMGSREMRTPALGNLPIRWGTTTTMGGSGASLMVRTVGVSLSHPLIEAR
jgi:hypothetical protein